MSNPIAVALGKLFAWAGVIIAAFVLGALVCRGDRSLARAELERDSLKAVAAELHTQDNLRAIAAAAAADSSRRRQAAIDALEGQAARSRAAVTLLQHRLDSIPGFMVPRELVNQVLAGKDDEIRATVARGDSLRALYLTALRQAAVADSSARSWRQLAIARGVSLDHALKARRWGCVVGGGAIVGPALAGNAVQTTAGFGGAIGFGVICGRTFA